VGLVGVAFSKRAYSSTFFTVSAQIRFLILFPQIEKMGSRIVGVFIHVCGLIASWWEKARFTGRLFL